MKRFGRIAKIGALVGLGFVAPPAESEVFELGQTSAIVPSERLRIFAFGRALGQRTATAAQTSQLRADMEKQGFYHDTTTPAYIHSSFDFTPTFGYDPNINGGYQQPGITIGGLYLIAAPENLARGGITFGADVESDYRFAWSNGRFIAVDVIASATHAPALNEGKQNLGIAICSRNHVVGWNFIDLCHRRADAWRGDRQAGVSTTDISFTKLFDATSSYHELNASIGRRDDLHNFVGLNLISVWPEIVTRAGVVYSEPVPNQFSSEVRFTSELRWRDGGGLTGIGFWHETASGGRIAGIQRHDRTMGISVSRELSPTVAVTLQAMRYRSSIDLFDYDQVSLSFLFDLGL